MNNKINSEKVSVIVPAYNVGQYISECINALLNQTYNNYEIIIINDGSTDNTLDVCMRFQNHNKINIINQENMGVSITRNNGIRLAKGKYIVFVDPDDIVSDKYLELLVKNIVSYNADMAICEYTNSFKEMDKNSSDNISLVSAKDIIIQLVENKLKDAYIWNKIYKKDIIIAEGLYFPDKIKIWEDMYFLIQYLKKSNKVIKIPQVLYYYRIRENSAVTSTESTANLKDKLYILNKLKMLFSENGYKELIANIEEIYVHTYLRYIFLLDKDKNSSRNAIKEELKKFKILLAGVKLNKKEIIKYFYLNLKYLL